MFVEVQPDHLQQNQMHILRIHHREGPDYRNRQRRVSLLLVDKFRNPHYWHCMHPSLQGGRLQHPIIFKTGIQDVYRSRMNLTRYKKCQCNKKRLVKHVEILPWTLLSLLPVIQTQAIIRITQMR